MFSFGRQVGSAPDEILPALLFYFNFQGLRTEIGVLYVEAVRFPVLVRRQFGQNCIWSPHAPRMFVTEALKRQVGDAEDDDCCGIS